MPKITKPTGTIISTLKAVDIAWDWHGGMGSDLHSFASTKKYIDKKFSEYISEIDENKPETSSQKERLESLKRYFQYKHWKEINNVHI